MEQLIEFRNVYKSYGKLEVLKGISTTISRGEIVAIIGTSGSGKSTMIRCINGLEKIQSGEILVNGNSIGNGKKQSRDIRKKIGMVFQGFNLFPHYTVYENVVKPNMIANRIDREEAEKIAMSLLRKVKLEDKINSYPHSLSGGQKQRVAIARALAMNPQIILFNVNVHTCI